MVLRKTPEIKKLKVELSNVDKVRKVLLLKNLFNIFINLVLLTGVEKTF